MAPMKTLGILTGGGDVPGLNPCIKAVVDRAVDDGMEIIGFRRGWAGPSTSTRTIRRKIGAG